MISRLWQIRVVSTMVALGTSTGSAASQDVSHRSTAMVIRYQLGSIAEEIADKLQLTANSAVAVTVQPSFGASLAENAIVEALQHRGYRAFLKPERDSVRVSLNINVLTDRAQFREIGQTGYERTVQTELEARSERGGGDSVTVLGIFHRVYSDTVSVKDAEVQVPHQGGSTDEEATLFQRLVGPLIVLASGIMVVYLFFTVRS
jgi:hypothetical protein